MSSTNDFQEPEAPRTLANVVPPMSANAGQTKLIVDTVEQAVAKSMRDGKNSDLLFLLSTFAAGFVLLAGMLIFGYLRIDDKLTSLDSKTSGKVDGLTVTSTRIETKLEDLLQRIPPVQAAPPRR